MFAPAAQSQHSIWLDVDMPGLPALQGEVRCDVCIVGGGIAGLLVAERLMRDGARVVLLEKEQLAHGETGHTTAHFATALDDRLYQLAHMHGEVGARLASESHRAAVGYAEDVIGRVGIDCGWTRLPGYLVVNPQHADRRDELISLELEACRNAGQRAERVSALPAPWPQELGKALHFPDQAQVHPLRFLQGVARHLLDGGVRLHTQSHVMEIKGGANAHVETDAGARVLCDHVVVATNTPINNRVAIHTKQSGYQTYVMAFRIPRDSLPALLLWDGLWEHDTSYRYVRMARGELCGMEDGDVLIVGGEDHKTGQGPAGDEPFRCIEQWTRSHFPMAGDVERRWSGEVMEPADGLAFIGRNPFDQDNVYIVTGDSGNGMTHGAIAAMLVPDLISRRENPWATLYDPARKVGLHSFTDFAEENANTLAQYLDWLKSGDAEDESQIAPGEGAVIRHGLKHIAVYKDESGCCTRLNAMCTHLAGVVHWNAQEKTWDCPCHASRFDKHGKVIHGPANTDLHPANDNGGANHCTR